MPMQQWLEIGRVVAAQGLRGEVRVQPATDFAERLTRPGVRLVGRSLDNGRVLRLQSGRAIPGKELFVCRFEGIEERNAAENLVGSTLWSDAAERPVLAAGEFWLPDLMGARVFRQDTGEAIGKVSDMTRAGNDLLVIRLSGGQTVMVPFVHALVPVVDLEAGRIEVAPIPGLLDLAEADQA